MSYITGTSWNDRNTTATTYTPQPLWSGSTSSRYWDYTSEEAIRQGIERFNQAMNSNTKKDNMSTIEKVKAERREKRERAEIEKLYDEYDNHGTVEGWEDGTIVRFSWTPPKERNADDKTYKFAAIWTNGHWYLTGPQYGGAGYTVETFVDFLVDKRIKHTDLEFLGA